MREELKREREAREESQRAMHQEMTQAILESSKNQFEALRMTIAAITAAPFLLKHPFNHHQFQPNQYKPLSHNNRRKCKRQLKKKGNRARKMTRTDDELLLIKLDYVLGTL